jgi:starvation-inducible DNA-binding protein
MEMNFSAAPAPSTFDEPAIRERSGIAQALNRLLANVFALYVRTKSSHWHMSGPHFRDYHLLLDEQASQLFAMTDVLAERVRKIGEQTLRSIADIHRLQSAANSESRQMEPILMLMELLQHNRHLVTEMRAAHRLCDEGGDAATASVLETFIDEGERRVWFLREICDEPMAL